MTNLWLFLMSLIVVNHGLLVRKLTSNTTLKFYHQTAQFGPRPNTTGRLVLSETEDGCKPPNGTYKNCVVLIKRGNCYFSTKVLRAQEHGAVGVIIGNNHATTEWISMVTTNLTATYRIPAVFIQNVDYNTLASYLRQSPTPVSGKRRLGKTRDIWIATINSVGEHTQGEYRTNRSSSMTIWKFVGYLLLFIPTVWCLVTVVLVIVRTLRSCVNRQRRVRRLESIPEVEYTGTKKENTSEPTTTKPDQNENDHGSEKRETDSEDGSPPIVTSIVPSFAAASETSETKLLDGANHEMGEEIESNNKKKLRISKLWNSLGKRNSPVPTPHNDTCSICLEEFVRGTKICLLPCGHGYHPECIHPWLRRQSEFCPTCRQSIFADEAGRSVNVWNFFKCCTNRSRTERRRADDSGQEMVAIPNDSDDEDDVDENVNGEDVENDVDFPTEGTYAELPNAALTREQKIVLQSVRRMGL